jgi:hypothetical protein
MRLGDVGRELLVAKLAQVQHDLHVPLMGHGPAVVAQADLVTAKYAGSWAHRTRTGERARRAR